MKRVGELKEKVEKTATKEEAKEVIADDDMELTDEEPDMVAGGNKDYGEIADTVERL